MSFSFTAPQFTQKQQEAERKGLSEEERQRIEADAYGTGKEIVETEELLKKSLAEFQEQLEAIPNHEKIDYEEALKRCPTLVETESAPIFFLRCEDFEAQVRETTFWFPGTEASTHAATEISERCQTLCRVLDSSSKALWRG